MIFKHAYSNAQQFLLAYGSVLSDSVQPHELQPTGLLSPWNSPGKHTGVGCHSLLQGILPAQGLNLGLLHYKQILYCLSHQGSPPCLREIKHKAVRNWSIIPLTMTAQYLNKILEKKIHHHCPIIKYFLFNISIQVSPLTDKFGIGNREDSC